MFFFNWETLDRLVGKPTTLLLLPRALTFQATPREVPCPPPFIFPRAQLGPKNDRT